MATIAAIWNSLSQRFELFFIYKSPRCFLSFFESIGLSVQKKKGKIDFQDGCHGGHLGFPIGMILAIFDLFFFFFFFFLFGFYGLFKNISLISSRSFIEGGRKPIFDLQVTPMFPSKFGVSWPFGSGKEAENRFSRWLPWWPSWISKPAQF